VTGYSWDGRGHLAAVSDPLGASTLVESDAAGLPVMVTAPDGATTRYERDGFGRVITVVAPDGSVTSLGWTTEGQLASRTFPDGTAERFSYDGEENLIAHVNPAAGLTKFEYGCFDQVAAQTGPDGTRTEFSYDHGLRLTGVTHGGLAWRYEYDPAGRLMAETDYNGATTRYARDAAGQLTKQVNAAGQRLACRYDLLGNLAERDTDGAVTSFGYGPAGLLAWAKNADADLVFERDAAGRVTAETCNGRIVRSAYDRAGRRVLRVTPSGAETRWAFDLAGRTVALQAAGQELRFGYDQVGRETLRELPGDVRLAQGYDPAGRLASQVLTAGAAFSGPGISPGGFQSGPDVPLAGAAGPGRVLQRRRYTYRADGVLAGLEDLLSGPRRFGLDAAGRVTRVAGPEWTEQYAYDPAGNITNATWPAPPPSLAAPWAGIDVQGRRQYAGTMITRAGGIRYRHDGQGRVTSRQQVRLSRKPDTWHYTWDADNRLTSVTTPDRTTWRYLYDPLGRRIAKQCMTSVGDVIAQTHFTWEGPTLAEQATFSSDCAAPGPHRSLAACSSGLECGQVITWDYQPGTFTPLTQTEYNSWRGVPQDQIDKRFYAIVTDMIGAPAELVSPDGDLAGYQQRTLWGTTLWEPAGAATPLRFPGQYHDPETGLDYNHHRYYDPVTGRYLTPDPLGLAPAPNPYTYVSNPTIGIDPLGLSSCPNGNAETAQAAGPPRGADFIASKDGTIVSTSRARLEGGFQEAGFPSTPTRSPGMQYTLPDGSLVRVMEPSGQAPLRASFTDSYGNPINPFTGRQPMPPPGVTGAAWRQLMRSLTHVRLGP
jgi:RHS repeat-associated protein